MLFCFINILLLNRDKVKTNISQVSVVGRVTVQC